MKIDILVAEIGSTTTVVNAFNGIGDAPVFVGWGHSPTTVNRKDKCGRSVAAAFREAKSSENTRARSWLIVINRVRGYPLVE